MNKMMIFISRKRMKKGKLILKDLLQSLIIQRLLKNHLSYTMKMMTMILSSLFMKKMKMSRKKMKKEISKISFLSKILKKIKRLNNSELLLLKKMTLKKLKFKKIIKTALNPL